MVKRGSHAFRCPEARRDLQPGKPRIGRAVVPGLEVERATCVVRQLRDIGQRCRTAVPARH
jgi:hypothetical protein